MGDEPSESAEAGDAPPPPPEETGERCPECGGSGERDGRECPACEGTGNVMRGLGGG
jgi:DnaJ-class molecular chaperone